jgi:hypothetical protein
MPRKQRGGFSLSDLNPFSSNTQEQQPPVQDSEKITAVAKDVAHTSILAAIKSALAIVRAGKGAAEGAAAEAGTAGYELSSEAVKQTGRVGEQAIQTSGEIAVAELQGLSEGGKQLAKEVTEHTLIAIKELGVGGLKTTESMGKALQSPEFQKEVEESVKTALVGLGYGVKDVGLIVLLVTKVLAKGLSIAVASIGGSRRKSHRNRKTHRSKNRSHRLKRRTAKHR